MRLNLKVVMMLACILFSVVYAEEASRLTNNAVASTMDEHSTYKAERINNLEFFYSTWTTIGDTNGGGKKELSLQLTELHKLKMVTAINNQFNNNVSKTWNDASIWLGTDTSYLSTTLTECIVDLNDSFLQTLSLPCQQIESGVITLRRESLAAGFSSTLGFALAMAEMRVY